MDTASPKKQEQSQNLVEQALSNHQGIISYQVVQEFLNVATRKFTPPLSASESKQYLTSVLSPLGEVFPSIELYQKALTLAEDFKYSFYDSLIIAAALQAGYKKLYSEDLQNDHVIDGLKIKNSFIT